MFDDVSYVLGYVLCLFSSADVVDSKPTGSGVCGTGCDTGVPHRSLPLFYKLLDYRQGRYDHIRYNTFCSIGLLLIIFLWLILSKP